MKSFERSKPLARARVSQLDLNTIYGVLLDTAAAYSIVPDPLNVERCNALAFKDSRRKKKKKKGNIPPYSRYIIARCDTHWSAAVK